MLPEKYKFSTQILIWKKSLKSKIKDALEGLHGGPVVKNLPCHSGDVCLIPGQGSKIPHVSGHKPTCHN